MVAEKCPHCKRKWSDHPGVLLLCEDATERKRLLNLREIIGGNELFKLTKFVGWATEFHNGIGKLKLTNDDVVMVDAAGRICRTSKDVENAFADNKFPISVRKYR